MISSEQTKIQYQPIISQTSSLIKDPRLNRNNNNNKLEGRICLFNSFTCSVEEIARFHILYAPCQVATTKNKVNSYVRYFE